MAKPNFTVERTGKEVLTVRLNFKMGQEHWFLLRADAHHDHAHCDQAMEKRHLDEAVARNAGIMDFGDLFCAMQGKWDKRASRDSMRPEYQFGNYLDRLVDCAAEFYQPYADRWMFLAKGNHETGIMKHHETSLTDRLASVLRDRTQNTIEVMPYRGWVRFMVTAGNHRSSVRLWYIHGYGGGGPVTADMIQASRQLVDVRNADVLVSGHTHDCWTREFQVETLSESGEILRHPIHYVKTPSYKDMIGHGDGWDVERGGKNKPLGAWWMKITLPNMNKQPRLDFVRAR